jgi:phosphate starvation-inducible protein PhoH and related proteins
MSNKKKYGGPKGGTKRRRKQSLAAGYTGDFEMQSQVKPRQKKNLTLNALSESQSKYIELIDEYDIIFADGRAGCGKTFVSTAIGLIRVLKGEYDKLVVTRPVMEAGERLGFLPGNPTEKIRPYIEPIHDTLKHFISTQEIQTLINSGKIEIAPLAYMRGRTFNNSFIIVDEAQNCSMKQLKMAITRLGKASKIIVNGDVSQSDFEEDGPNALKRHIEIFEKKKHSKIAVFRFNPNEIVRNSLIAEYLDAMESTNAKSN